MAVLTPFFVIAAGWIAGLVARHVPGANPGAGTQARNGAAARGYVRPGVSWMLFGGYADHDGAGGPNGAVPGVTCVRQHLYEFDSAGKWRWPPVNGPVPPAWPASPAYAPDARWFFTIYPNPDQLLAGRLDARIRDFLADAPPYSSLTAYAEADGRPDGVPQWEPLGLTVDKLLDIHRHMFSLTTGTNVGYGPVVCGFGADSAAYCPPGMDFYGLDIYDAPGSLPGKLDQWRANTARQVGTDLPTLALAETNTNVPARRPTWFKAVFSWLKSYESRGARVRCMCTYWNPGGPLSGPWLPDDTTVIGTLRAIAQLAHDERDGDEPRACAEPR
ncbi:MAG TPA: hypothetical protein VK817_04145 [Trebonia sp.]|nr:hypothetical protein [Trebonia sp.]